MYHFYTAREVAESKPITTLSGCSKGHLACFVDMINLLLKCYTIKMTLIVPTL